MIYGTRVFYAKRTGHAALVLKPQQNVNTKDLTPPRPQSFSSNDLLSKSKLVLIFLKLQPN